MSKRSVAAMLKKARRRQELFTVLLDLGDGVQDEYDEAVNALSTLQAGGRPKVKAKAAEYDKQEAGLKRQVVDITARLAEGQIDGTFEALPPLKWAAILDDHPPREGNQLDLMIGANMGTVFPDAIRACMVEPDFRSEDDDDTWDDFLAALSPGDVARLGRQVFELNARSASVPKLPKDFLPTAPPDSGSKPQEPGD